MTRSNLYILTAIALAVPYWTALFFLGGWWGR